MSRTELDAWSRRSVARSAAEQVAAGALSPADATAFAQRAFADLLPHGLETPQHWLWTVRDADGGTVGHAWLRVRRLSSEVEAFLVDVDVEDRLRGRGLGSATLRAVEQAARDLGADVLRLTVLGHNRAALRLYDAAGLAVARTALTRSLTGPVARPAPAGAAPPEELRRVDDRTLQDRTLAAAVRQLVDSGTAPRAEAAAQVARLRGSVRAGADGSAALLELHDRSDGPLAVAHHLLPGHAPVGRLLDAVEHTARRLGASALSVTAYDDPGAVAERGYRVTAQTRVTRW